MSSNIFKYVAYNSFVHPSFWHKLTEIKIDVDKLNDNKRAINAFYTNSNATHCLFEIDCTAFNQQFEGQTCKFRSHGGVYNKNTVEDFKKCDKTALINGEGADIWQDITTGLCLEDPSRLSRFTLITYADMKKFNYYYWFAYPCLSEPMVEQIGSCKAINEHFNQPQFDAFNQQYFARKNSEQQQFFIIEADGDLGDGVLYSQLADKISSNNKEANFAEAAVQNLYFCYSDPCATPDVAGWTARLYLTMIIHLCPRLRGQVINIISVRVKGAVSIENSIVFTVKLPENDIDAENLKWIGWEANNQGKYLPKCAMMSSSMDPEKLSESGVTLNLKLMKWRLMPDLDLNIIANTKCLLIGSGTLGCNVSRGLIAWGVRNITLADSGHVSHSNPVRQSLFVHDDAVHGREKSKTAAARLKEIYPGLNTAGHFIHIPMPGHPVGESMVAKTLETIRTLEKLIDEHDAIFMLTDSRESRWLPTLLGVYHNKIVINAALGFDSYMVMRHGSHPPTSDAAPSASPATVVNGLKCIPGYQLGCYFCNDITAPGDSQKDRTLDQQCTVTRPAVSSIAASLAVELLVSILQHADKNDCPAYVAVNNMDIDTIASNTPEGLLGIIPHSIRGQLSNYEQILPATEKFAQCIACSSKIIEEYKNNGNTFLLQVFGSSKYLEDLSGITELMAAQHDEVLEFNDSDFELSD